MDDAPGPRSLRAGDVEAAIAAMVAAFVPDPLYVWLYPDVSVRPERLHETFELVLDAACDHGEVMFDADGRAVAVWTAPGVSLLDSTGQARFARMLRRHLGPTRAAVAEAGMAMSASHRPAEPHATLHSLSVHPASAGRGVGTALVAGHLARLDADGIVAHLDSSNARNLPFYERLGFRIVAEVRVGGDGPVLRSMVRPPHPSASPSSPRSNPGHGAGGA